MSFKKIIALLNLGTGFELDTPNSKIHVKEQVEAVTVNVMHFGGRSQNGVSVSYARNCTVTRVATGLWNVAFATPHPLGVNYHPSLVVEEQADIADPATAVVVQGTQLATGFQVRLYVRDNVGIKDIPTNVPWSFEASVPVNLAIVKP